MVCFLFVLPECVDAPRYRNAIHSLVVTGQWIDNVAVCIRLLQNGIYKLHSLIVLRIAYLIECERQGIVIIRADIVVVGHIVTEIEAVA